MPTASFYGPTDLGYAQLTAFDAAPINLQTITFDSQPGPGVPIGTQVLMIKVEGAAARYRTDNIAPTNTTGYLLTVRNQDIMINVAQFPQFQIIGTTPATIANIIALGNVPP